MVPGFAVVDAEPPVLINNYTMVSFTFRTLLGEAHARMMTDRACQNHVILSRLNVLGVPDTPVCVMSLDVAREGARGHSITLRGQLFRGVSPWVRVVMGMALQLRVWEAVLAWGYANRNEHPHLEMYRTQVLLRGKMLE
jgi:hypothetical protein